MGIPLPAKLREEISSRLIFLSFFLIIQSRLKTLEMKLMMWTFIMAVMLVVFVRARPEGSNSNGNEVAPADQVKEKNEMRQDGLFGNLFKMGKKLLPKVLGHAGHDNHDQDYNDGNEKVAKDFFRAKMPTPCKEAVMKCN